MAVVHRDRDPSLKTLLQQEALKARGLYTGELDNWWGPKSEAAYKAFLHQMGEQETVHFGIASTFADYDDLEAFRKCKAKGKTDLECFAVGDNGIGESGKVTSQDTDPMFALHYEDIIQKWGSKSNAWGKKLKVTYQEKECVGTLEDRMSSPHAQIDCNPAAVKQLGLPKGGMVKVKWEWV